MCEMSIGTNSDWSCVCETVIKERLPNGGDRCSLLLRSTWTNQKAALDVSVRNEVVSTSISRSGTTLTIGESHSVASNQTEMASVIDDFIAAQASAFGVQP
jgi:hypothetical protein